MESQSLSTLLKKYKLHPRKGLGQNFLSDPFHLDKIIEAAELSDRDTVLEIGPGPGTLTQHLAQKAGRVVAVEVDPGMVNLLRQEYGQYPNLTIKQADILKSQISSLLKTPPQTKGELEGDIPYKVVANLPYYITSAVIRYLLESSPQPRRLVVTVQKEVAQRIVAQPGKMSVLAVSVQFYGQPTLVHHIPASAFYPAPKVDSAVIRVDTYSQAPVVTNDTKYFFQVVKAGFSQKRKQIKNALAGGLNKPNTAVISALTAANIAPTRRAETLSMAEWADLVRAFQHA